MQGYPRINRYYEPDGFIWYEFTYNGANLLSDSVRQLVAQIKSVYGLDYSMYLQQFEIN